MCPDGQTVAKHNSPRHTCEEQKLNLIGTWSTLACIDMVRDDAARNIS